MKTPINKRQARVNLSRSLKNRVRVNLTMCLTLFNKRNNKYADPAGDAREKH